MWTSRCAGGSSSPASRPCTRRAASRLTISLRRWSRRGADSGNRRRLVLHHSVLSGNSRRVIRSAPSSTSLIRHRRNAGYEYIDGTSGRMPPSSRAIWSFFPSVQCEPALPHPLPSKRAVFWPTRSQIRDSAIIQLQLARVCEVETPLRGTSLLQSLDTLNIGHPAQTYGTVEMDVPVRGRAFRLIA